MGEGHHWALATVGPPVARGICIPWSNDVAAGGIRPGCISSSSWRMGLIGVINHRLFLPVYDKINVLKSSMYISMR